MIQVVKCCTQQVSPRIEGICKEKKVIEIGKYKIILRVLCFDHNHLAWILFSVLAAVQ